MFQYLLKFLQRQLASSHLIPAVYLCSTATVQPLPSLPLILAESEQSNSLASEFDCSIEDAEKRQAVDDVTASERSCILGKLGTSCSKQLSRTLIESTRQECLDMTRRELYLIILSQITHTKLSEVYPTMRHVRLLHL